LVVRGTRTKEISEFTMFAAEPAGSLMALEATHTSDPVLDGAMVVALQSLLRI
jgi:hypothetical protein